MTLKLTYRKTTTVPVEIEGVTPESVRDSTLEEIREREIFVGNQKVPLRECFDVSGDPGDLTWEMDGDLSGVHWIGAHMREGTIRVDGDAGRHVGSQMEGGQIEVCGSAGDWVGGEMQGGTIHVRGSAGHLIGSAYRGSRVGMRGGTILIQGTAGNEVGHTMRRGLIAVGGAADMVGFNMLAGTIVVLGDCGIRPGAGMRRGTIALLGNDPPPILPTFRPAATGEPLALTLLVRELERLGYPIEPELGSARVQYYNGDLLDGGRGEILVRC